MGDGSTYEVIGVGTTKIKMFDGVVRTLDGVAYVPKMRRNLISLGWLDSMGCRFLAVDGVIKITWDYLVRVKGKNVMICIV